LIGRTIISSKPLLYQVATSVLAPGQIASPIRELLADKKNTSMMLGNVTDVDAAAKHVIVNADDVQNLSGTRRSACRGDRAVA
jgi:NADH dehydrogenase